MATSPTKVWARRPFGYANQQLDRGQIFELQGKRNDDRLVSYKYVEEVPKGTEIKTCSECGGEFIGESYRRTHGEKRHPTVPRTIEEEERLADREERVLAKEAPVGPQTVAA